MIGKMTIIKNFYRRFRAKGEISVTTSLKHVFLIKSRVKYMLKLEMK